jgi:hypothetical protein
MDARRGRPCGGFAAGELISFIVYDLNKTNGINYISIPAGPGAAFDEAVVLFDQIIEVFDLA